MEKITIKLSEFRKIIREEIAIAEAKIEPLDPENKGKFTAKAKRAGMTVKQFADWVLSHPDKYPPETRKQANFARNSRSWKKVNESSFDRYVVEARNEDGSLNAKHYDPQEPTSFITGATENELFDYYFRFNKDRESADWSDLTKWYKSKGLSIRKKTW